MHFTPVRASTSGAAALSSSLSLNSSPSYPITAERSSEPAFYIYIIYMYLLDTYLLINFYRSPSWPINKIRSHVSLVARRMRSNITRLLPMLRCDALCLS
ncbi:hypothetical protein BJX61DRAFT_346127 [Aspergillus egyptiacus]|nr:hypothetical protein BJX61DRAFT_346127 [Aspergillus egyptiacus]